MKTALKVRLEPNNKQMTKLFQSAGAARWAYNWTLAKQEENYTNGGKFINNGDLRKELTLLKQTEEYKWLNNYSNNITKQAVKDACDAPKFYQDTEKPFKNINKTKEVRKLEKKLRRLQRKVSNKYEKNKEGRSYVKTSNIVKLEKNTRKLHRRLDNIRTDYRHKVTAEIVKTKPSRIVIESLNVSGMMKNKHLSKSIQQQGFYEFGKLIQYKSEKQGTEFVVADKWYPSSKTCSVCGHVKTKLSLSEREFKCECCSSVIDRDKNASINLSRYVCPSGYKVS